MFDSFYGRPVAYARFTGSDDYPKISGNVYFYPENEGSLVVVRINGLPKPVEECGKRFYALHIHEGSNCTGDDFSNAGAHYNPENCPHPKHAGDLPPLLGCGTRAFMSVLTDSFTPWEIVGRTVIVHEGVDDFTTQPSGNAGAKIACAEIKLV